MQWVSEFRSDYSRRIANHRRSGSLRILVFEAVTVLLRNQLVPQKSSNLRTVESFDVKGHAQKVIFHVRNFDVAIIEKSVLVVQNVLAQIRSNLFVGKENLGLVNALDCAQNSQEVRFDVEATIDVEFACWLLLAAHGGVVAYGFRRVTFGQGGQQLRLQHFHLRQYHVPV